MPLEDPVLTGPGAGRNRDYGNGSNLELKLYGDQSGGDWAVVENRVRAGDEPPIHTHTREDESVYVVEGAIIAFVGVRPHARKLRERVQQRRSLRRLSLHPDTGDGGMTRRSQVIAEAETWLGTPYHHMGRVRGGGTDCLMLLAEVFASAGVIPRIEVPFYPQDWHLHRDAERYLNGWCDTREKFRGCPSRAMWRCSSSVAASRMVRSSSPGPG